MAITINSANPLWDNKQWLVVYEGFNAPRYPEIMATFAPSTDINNPTYYSGRLLSVYSEAHAPDPKLVGCYVNYDPDSSNVDQQTCVAVISSEWVNGLSGLDVTSNATATATFNQANVSKIYTGIVLYYSTLVANNTSAVLAGFNSQFVVSEIETIQVNGLDSALITVQGVQ